MAATTEAADFVGGRIEKINGSQAYKGNGTLSATIPRKERAGKAEN